MKNFCYGIEIEIIKKRPREVCRQIVELLPTYLFSYDADKIHTKHDKWDVGYDASVDTEIRSPILIEDYSSVFPVLKALKEIGCETDKDCGLHIHFSTLDKKVLDAFDVQDVLMRKHAQRIGWPSRIVEYARYEPTLYGTYRPKYRAVRQIADDHIEFRIFNGSLNCRAIHTYLKIVDQVMSEYVSGII